MATESARTLSVGAAAGLGVTGLVAAAEGGTDITLERYDRAVAAVISAEHLAHLNGLRWDQRVAALVMARELTDTGARTDLDQAIAALGFDRTELEDALDDALERDTATGRE